MTLFFVSGTSDVIENSLKFSLFWIGPVVIAVLVIWMVRAPRFAFASISGLSAGLYIIFLFYIIAKVALKDNQTEFENWDYIFSLLSPYLIFFISLIFSLFKNKYKENLFVKGFLTFPIILVLVQITFKLFNYSIKYNLIKLIPIIVIALILTVITTYYSKKYASKNENQQKDVLIIETVQSTNFEISINKLVIFFCFIPVCLTMIVTLIPNVLYLMSIYTREMSINAGSPLVNNENIIYNEQSVEPLQGLIVAEKDGIYYISDKTWRLVRIKSEFLKSLSIE